MVCFISLVAKYFVELDFFVLELVIKSAYVHVKMIEQWYFIIFSVTTEMLNATTVSAAITIYSTWYHIPVLAVLLYRSSLYVMLP